MDRIYGISLPRGRLIVARDHGALGIQERGAKSVNASKDCEESDEALRVKMDALLEMSTFWGWRVEAQAGVTMLTEQRFAYDLQLQTNVPYPVNAGASEAGPSTANA